MLIPNVLFRCNGSAVLLTNKAKHVKRAKYSIPHIVRTNLASNDVAFNCVMQTEDAERKLGVRLNKDLIKVRLCLLGCAGMFWHGAGLICWPAVQSAQAGPMPEQGPDEAEAELVGLCRHALACSKAGFVRVCWHVLAWSRSDLLACSAKCASWAYA
jgi:hypothetical protein